MHDAEHQRFCRHSKTVTPLAVKETELHVELLYDTPTVGLSILATREMRVSTYRCSHSSGTKTSFEHYVSSLPGLGKSWLDDIYIQESFRSVRFFSQCMCRSAALMLPPYSESDPNSNVVPHGWNAPLGMISERKNECFCGVESHAVEETTAALTSAESSRQSSPLFNTIPLQKEGSDTSLTRHRSA